MPIPIRQAIPWLILSSSLISSFSASVVAVKSWSIWVCARLLPIAQTQIKAVPLFPWSAVQWPIRTTWREVPNWFFWYWRYLCCGLWKQNECMRWWPSERGISHLDARCKSTAKTTVCEGTSAGFDLSCANLFPFCATTQQKDAHARSQKPKNDPQPCNEPCGRPDARRYLSGRECRTGWPSQLEENQVLLLRCSCRGALRTSFSRRWNRSPCAFSASDGPATRKEDSPAWISSKPRIGNAPVCRWRGILLPFACGGSWGRSKKCWFFHRWEQSCSTASILQEFNKPLAKSRSTALLDGH